MSTILGQSTQKSLFGRYQRNDDILQPAYYRRTRPGTRRGSDLFSDVLWPRPRLLGAPDAPPTPMETMGGRWEWDSNYVRTGTTARRTVTGLTFDANGNPLGGCAVFLFNTATNLLVDSGVSDASGAYRLSDPNVVACYVVAYLAGSPDVVGTTVNTLVGS